MGSWKNRKKYKIDDLNQTKKSFFSRVFKRQMVITMVSILAVTIVLLGSTYAVFSSVNKSTDYNTIHVGTLDIAYDDTSTGMGDAINLNEAYPMTDADGQAQTGYKFKITNTGSLTSVYSVKIADDLSVIEADGCEDKLLDKSQIKVSIDGGTPFILADLAEKSYEIATGSLESGESRTFTIRMWIKGDAGNEVLAKHYHGKITVTASQEDVMEGDVFTFSYTGTPQIFEVPTDGIYRIETWGAQGGSYDQTIVGGKGGYAKGELQLTKGTLLYVYVGGEGASSLTSKTGTLAGGYNGGGNAYTTTTSTLVSAGGGATDVRYGTDEIASRIVIAGGGGGTGSYDANNHYAGGYGGGSTGGNGNSYSTEFAYGLGGTDIVSGNSYYGTLVNDATYGTLAGLGVGGSATALDGVAGGGGGFYGGGYAYRASAGGGSGYVCTTVSDFCKVFLENVVLTAGNSSMPSQTGTEFMIGNTGNGFARITFLSK